MTSTIDATPVRSAKMPGKIKVTPAHAHAHAPAPALSQREIDEKWEQIRLRGEQISADIKALLAQVSSNAL